MDDGQLLAKKGRGRPRKSRSLPTKPPMSGEKQHTDRASEATLVAFPEDSVQKELPTPFCMLLRTLSKQDRAIVSRVARGLDVTENTVYRWIHGMAEPRVIHLRRLPEVLPEQRSELIAAINETFDHVLDFSLETRRDVPKEIYLRVAEIMSTIDGSDRRFWQVSQAVLSSLLHQLDADKSGMAVTYAHVMPLRSDGIHSLREAIMLGHAPWPVLQESRIYLGCTTLAGTAAILQRMQIWNDTRDNDRLQVEVDDFERSACAVPVTRGSRIAGVMIVSSAQPAFFDDLSACQVVEEYARLLGLALPDTKFLPFSSLSLRPMPSLNWQRQQITDNYVRRVLACASSQALSYHKAEQRVQSEMEQEFENLMHQLSFSNVQ